MKRKQTKNDTKSICLNVASHNGHREKEEWSFPNPHSIKAQSLEYNHDINYMYQTAFKDEQYDTKINIDQRFITPTQSFVVLNYSSSEYNKIELILLFDTYKNHYLEK